MPFGDNCGQWDQLTIFSRDFMQRNNIIFWIELRPCHFKGLLDCHFLGVKIVLIAFIVHEDIVDIEHECFGLEHLVGSRMHRPELIWQGHLVCRAFIWLFTVYLNDPDYGGNDFPNIQYNVFLENIDIGYGLC